MRAGEFPNGARVLRAKIDMAVAQHQPARSGPVPDRPRRAPADRRRLVHLPDLRLRARAVRRDRGRDPLDLHPGVRGAPAALRLADRAPAGAPRPPPVRVRAAQPHPHRALEAGPANGSSTRATSAAGTTRGCRRSPACGGAGSRRRASATSPRGRGLARRQRPSRSAARARRARDVLNRTAARAVRRARSPQGRDHQLAGGTGRDARGRQQPRGPGGGDAAGRVFGRELWIERDDFQEEPRPKFFRLAPGREVRLRNAYFVTCREVVKDAAGRVVELRCDVRPGDARR